MIAKQVNYRPQARQDMMDATDHYAEAAGSPVYGHTLKLPGLRTRPVRRFPYLVFYFDNPGQIDITRVLHLRREIRSGLLQVPQISAPPN
jgi:plasmid stabilization system protein ParE